MGRFKNHLLVMIGFAVAGAIGAAFGTGTAQAVVSTLVSVVNPTTSPVPTSPVNVTDPGRIPYQSTVDMAGRCVVGGCFWEFGSPPAGHRIVIQHISGLLEAATAPSETFVRLNNTPPAGTGNVAAFAFLAPASTTLIAFDQAVQAYFDPANIIEVSVSLVGGTFAGSGFEVMTLTGYELDCTVAACAPIATQ